MPTPARVMIQWNVGSTLPRDIMQITPCFELLGTPADGDPAWQALADDVAASVETWSANPRKVTVKVYDITEEAPGHINRPKAVKVGTATTTIEAPSPREIALCLSFYGGNNEPRERGRLYLPAFMTTAGTLGVRPSTTIMDKGIALANALEAIGSEHGPWIVWSPTNDEAVHVTNAFVDDEWDTVRKRGLKPTARSTSVVG